MSNHKTNQRKLTFLQPFSFPNFLSFLSKQQAPMLLCGECRAEWGCRPIPCASQSDYSAKGPSRGSLMLRNAKSSGDSLRASETDKALPHTLSMWSNDWECVCVCVCLRETTLPHTHSLSGGEGGGRLLRLFARCPAASSHSSEA